MILERSKHVKTIRWKEDEEHNTYIVLKYFPKMKDKGDIYIYKERCDLESLIVGKP